jgi:predicted Fe-Mo cluster-binding NifX family protein
MKIAVPVSKDNIIEAHIGNCEYYNVFTTTDNKQIKAITRIKSPGGCGCNTDIASVLASDGVSTVLAAGIGGGSTRAFNKSGINVISGCSGDSTKLVNLYLSGLIEDKGSSCHKHQQQHHYDKSVTQRVPEIAGLQSSEHKYGCGHGGGNSCHN